MKIKRVNIIHLNENGKRIASSTFTPHKGHEPVAKDEKELFHVVVKVILNALKLPHKSLKIKDRKMKNALIDITTTKGKFYF